MKTEKLPTISLEMLGKWDDKAVDYSQADHCKIAWPGGQILARYILDNPSLVSGKKVLDICSGSGVVALAALEAGAAEVTASDIEANAVSTMKRNFVSNQAGGGIRSVLGDFTDLDAGEFDVIAAASCFWNNELAEKVISFARGKGLVCAELSDSIGLRDMKYIYEDAITDDPFDNVLPEKKLDVVTARIYQI
jgi:predicted nicotinamide N-methyase